MIVEVLCKIFLKVFHRACVGCMLRKTVRVPPGHRNRPNSTIPSAGLHIERAAREQTIMCNQAAGLSRCLTRVQDSISTQLKTLRLDSKGKSSEKMKHAVNELEYLNIFNLPSHGKNYATLI